jgi:nitrite reductase/ring-hydroxylating ferredoxin subunit
VDRWFPVARSEDVVPRHVAQTQLLGQEIALWRDDGGSVNAWENRCPHRGVRLSIGDNTGTELRCQYHGWRFAGGSGQCTFIPAHPSQRPASTMHAVVHAAVERYGYVWVNVDPHTDAPDPPMPRPTGVPESASTTTLRSIFVEAPAAALAEALQRGYWIDAGTETPVLVNDPFMLTATSGAKAVTFLLQPVAASQTVLHGLLHADVDAAHRLALLRHHNAHMTRLRDAVERNRAAVPLAV